jgi:hypothetical protein
MAKKTKELATLPLFDGAEFLPTIEDRRKEIKPVTEPQRKKVITALNETFELLGGVPRLTLWANNPSNTGDFYKIWARSGQSLDVIHSGEVIIRPSLPPSPLDEGPPPLEGECRKL